MSAPFSEEELARALESYRDLCPDHDWGELKDLFAETLHKSHKNWAETEAAAERLANIIGGPDDAAFRRVFERVLVDGRYDAAAAAVSSRKHSAKPWVVLVTGLNGIRKTTSVHQPWFKDLLKQALGDQFDGTAAELPSGEDSFFRQLDYMIATLALTEFKQLYTLDETAEYASAKAEIFGRYRMAAEMLGVLLVKDAQRKGLNIMVETSGRDIGMFNYIEHLFPDDRYRKLVLNFAINDIAFAEASVDSRMQREMADGRAALERAEADPMAVVRANAGGPYGSAVLAGVQADSQRVWKTVVDGSAGVGGSWYKASITISADAASPWSARAVGGVGSEVFAFGPPPGQ